MNRQQLFREIYKAINLGIQRNCDRIFSRSQDTTGCFVPRDTGFLAFSGDVIHNPEGKPGGMIVYRAPYACFPIKNGDGGYQKVLLANGAQIRLTSLNPGMIIDDGFGNQLEVIVVKKQPLSDRRLLEIETASGKKVVVTDDHRIALSETQFVEAGQLKIGDEICVSSEWIAYKNIKCAVCKKELREITHTHLKQHGMTTADYKNKYGPLTAEFELYIEAWNKNKTKDNDPRIAAYAKTLEAIPNWEKIKSIKDVTSKSGPESSVYDIQVSGDATLIVGGIVCHNSKVELGDPGGEPYSGVQRVWVKSHYVRGYTRKDGRYVTGYHVEGHWKEYKDARLITFRPKVPGSKFERGPKISRVLTKTPGQPAQHYLSRAVVRDIPSLVEDIDFYLKQLESKL